jgi:hypothetical protein
MMHASKTSFFAAIAFAAACQLPVPDQPAEGDDDDDSSEGGEAGRGGSGDAPEARLCDRIDECGYLGPGYTVGDCTDIVSACTGQLLTSAHQDWNVAAEGCLDLVNCQNFGTCFTAIDVCIADIEVDFDGETGDDPPPPPPSDDGGGDGSDDGGTACTPGSQACASDDSIAVCDDAGLVVIDCQTVCEQLGWTTSWGCGWDADSGVDICWCT